MPSFNIAIGSSIRLNAGGFGPLIETRINLSSKSTLRLHRRRVLMRFCLEKLRSYSTELTGSTLLIAISLIMFGNSFPMKSFIRRVRTESRGSAFLTSLPHLANIWFLKRDRSRFVSHKIFHIACSERIPFNVTHLINRFPRPDGMN